MTHSTCPECGAALPAGASCRCSPPGDSTRAPTLTPEAPSAACAPFEVLVAPAGSTGGVITAVTSAPEQPWDWTSNWESDSIGESSAPAGVPTLTPDGAPRVAGAGGLAPPGYELGRELGRGGMGVVYAARQVDLKRDVALKMILGAGRPGELERFLIEAEAAAAVDHPNVARLLDYGPNDGRPYMALEFCAGGSLAALVKAGAMPPREAAATVEKIARGVAAAHALGIVHRDLKPANVLLDARGEPKVADFGLAKLSGQDLTHPDAVMGTPSYMAPEQARASKLAGPPADVWALGVILYEALTGEKPFGTGTVPVIMARVQTQDPPPPRRLVPGVPRDLELVCLKCLEKAPGDRYPTARELADDLTSYLAGGPVSVRAPGPAERLWRWARRSPLRASAVAAGAGMAASVVAAGVIQARLDKATADLTLSRAEEKERAAEAQAAAAGDVLAAERAAALEGWGDVQKYAAAAAGRLAAVPALAASPLREQADALAGRARSELLAAAGRREARDRLAALEKRHDEAVTAVGVAADPADAAEAAADHADAGLELLDPAPAPGADAPPDLTLLKPGERRAAAEITFELLALEADALLRPGGADAAGRARLALARLDRADALLAPEPPPFCSRRLRAAAVTATGSPAAPPADTPPRLAADHFFAGLTLYRSGDFSGALAPLASALVVQPNHLGAEYFSALCRLRLREYQAARDGMTRCLDRRARLPWPRLARGLASTELRRFGEAQADFDAVLASPPSDLARYVALVNRGALAMRRGDWPGAERDFAAAARLRPSDPAARVNLAFAVRRRFEVPGWRHELLRFAPGAAAAVPAFEAAQRDARLRAVAVLDAAARDIPDEPRLFSERGRLFAQLGDHRRAESDLREALRLARARGVLGTAPFDFVELGRLRELAGDPREAVDAYRAALQAKPDLYRAERLAAPPLIALGRPAEAAAALDRYFAAAPTAAGRSGGDVPALLADALRARGLAAEEEARAFQARGLLHARDGSMRTALDCYTQSLAQARDAEVLALRGWTFLTLGAAELSLADFDEALRRRPSRRDALLGRANARARLGAMAEAAADAEAGLSGPPADARSLYQAARVFAQVGPWLARSRGDLEAAGRGVRRAVDLLDRAVQAQPAGERAGYWMRYVAADAAFDGIRGGDAMAGLATKYAGGTR